MSKINELRAQRAKTWEQTKAFLDSHRSDKGVLTAEDTATYEKMEQEIVDLGREIERQERLDAFERELNTPVNTPITQRPDTAKVDTKTGRASDAYKKAFWAQARTKGGMLTAEIRNALQEGVDSEGGTSSPMNLSRRWCSLSKPRMWSEAWLMSSPLPPAVTRSPSSPPRALPPGSMRKAPSPKAMMLSVSSSSAHTRSLP